MGAGGGGQGEIIFSSISRKKRRKKLYWFAHSFMLCYTQLDIFVQDGVDSRAH